MKVQPIGVWVESAVYHGDGEQWTVWCIAVQSGCVAGNRGIKLH